MIHDGEIRDYLIPASDTFWEWREAGEVVTWKNGKTIAFREELRSILAWLAPQGLPSLDSVLLLLAATHDSWNETGNEVHILAHLLDDSLSSPNSLQHEALLNLYRVRAMEPDLRTPVRAKSVLAESLLADCRRCADPELAVSIVETMRLGLGEQLTPPDVDVKSLGFGPVLLQRDMADMLPALRRIDADALRLRLATGLSSLPDKANIELSPSEAARALLDSLHDDVEFSGLSRVAKQLFAATSLPRRLDSDEQHLTGGFSDISNRGSMERLLISELANDDLTLAARVAMNEALYLRREVPPSATQRHRSVLIDVGIRSWGVPRVFATAVALALMAGTSKGAPFSCFRAKGNVVELADLTTRTGLIEHLRVLEADLHLTEALPAFLRHLEENETASEPILVMPEDALHDEEVQQALRGVDLPQLFVATINREGVFRLTQRGRHGVTPLREAKIDLNELFQKRPLLIDRQAGSDLPAIFACEPFPMLLSERLPPDRGFFIRDWGVLSATRDGRLLRWQSPKRGAHQISDCIVGSILWIAPTAVDGIVTLVAGGSSNASLMHVSDRNVVVDSVKLRPMAEGEHYFARNGVLFFIRRDDARVLSMHTGEVIQTLPLPYGVRWKRDRFFHTLEGNWLALSHDGQSARFEPIQCASEPRAIPPCITMFDRVGVDGPVAVTSNGDLFSTATGNTRRVAHNLVSPLIVPWIAPDGQRLQLRSIHSHINSNYGVLVNITNLETESANTSLLDDRARSTVRTIMLRHRFGAIGLDAAGNLALESRTGALFVFESPRGQPVATVRDRGSGLRARRGFQSMKVTQRKYKLSQAKWDDGSCAVLDSRGLLHLTSADRSVPAVALVLAEGEITGWCSDGRTWGKRFFFDGRRVLDESAAAQNAIFIATVLRFVERINA